MRQGAQVAKSPRTAAEGASFVISIVRDDQASRRVWLAEADGALAGMASSAIGIESSTLSVQWIRELAQKFAERGIAFLDAPVVGSRPQAEAAQLIHLVGGDTSALERVRPVLSRIQVVAAAMVAGQFTPAFPIALIEKDLGYLSDSVPATPLTSSAREVFARAISEGLADSNMTAVAQLYAARR
jgi:3-hydroxyisobutyrate dehydrogenase-like beta-hydroxyacid dehydrogenase